MDAFFSKNPERKSESSDSPPPLKNTSALDKMPQTKTSLPVEISDLIQMWHKTITEIGLEELITTVKEKDFNALNATQKELLCDGMLKLGEALTFCKNPSDNKAVKQTKTHVHVKEYVYIRNYFVHHSMYADDKNKMETFTKFFGTLKPLKFIGDLLENLKTRADTLVKTIGAPRNEFNFEFPHFFDCLEKEWKFLNTMIESITTTESVTSEARVSFDNRVRNILTIILDMTGQSGESENNNKKCIALKKAMTEVTTRFSEENEEFRYIFKDLKPFRNALCHEFDFPKRRPYINPEELIKFVSNLKRIYERGYLDQLKVAIQSEQQKAAATEKGSNPPEAPKEPSFQQEIEQGPQKKPKSVSGLERLSVYNEHNSATHKKTDVQQPDRLVKKEDKQSQTSPKKGAK